MNHLLARLGEARAQAIILTRNYGLDADEDMVALMGALDLAAEHAGFDSATVNAVTEAFLLVQTKEDR